MLSIKPNQEQHVRICLTGRVSQGQLSYLDELIHSASDSRLGVLLDMEQVTVLDLAAVRYLAEGEGKRFEFTCCPPAIRRWIQREQKIAALAESVPHNRTT